MPITIPDNGEIRMTTDLCEPNNGQQVPCVASVAMTNPGAVMVDPAGASSAGQIRVKPAKGAAGRAGYLGYNVLRKRANGQACGVVRGVIVDGFAGVTPSGRIFVDSEGADASATASGLTHTPPVAATQEVQTIDLSGADDPNGGTFTITWNGQTTAAIAWNAAATDVQTALEALSNIAPGDVVVTKSGFVYTLTWNSALGNVAAPTTTSSLTTAVSSITITTTTSTQGVVGYGDCGIGVGVTSTKIRFD